MHAARPDGTREILREVQARVPPGQRFAQEAFTSDHRRPVLVKLNELQPDTFYVFDEITVCALCDAVVEWAARHGGGRLTVSFSAFGEWRAQRHRLQHRAPKFSTVRVLTVGDPAGRTLSAPRLEITITNSSILSKYRLALREGPRPVLFAGRELPGRSAPSGRYLGFFTTDAETVDEVATDVDLAARGLTRRMATFERLELLHQTTQKVARELDSYSRRIELAIRRAQRRPDLLTPGRFDRIVRQSIAKIEQLKEIPRRALRTLGRG
jgi:hypothetical protein